MARKAKKESPPEPINVAREKVTVRQNFLPEERDELISQHFQKLRAASMRRERAKAEASEAKAEAKVLEQEAAELAEKFQNGYEMVVVDATVQLDRKSGTKFYRRYCPGKPEHDTLLKDEPMTEDDFQRLPLEEPTPAEGSEPTATEEQPAPQP